MKTAEQAHRISLVEETYRRLQLIADQCHDLESLVADLDDDVFSTDLVSLEQALFRFDRDLRARR